MSKGILQLAWTYRRAWGMGLLLAVAGPARAEVYQWNGSNSTAWTTTANWQPTAGSVFLGPAPTGGIYNVRLNVNNGALNELVYDASLGDTVYASTTTAGIPSRGLVIGSGSAGSGYLRITGGSLSTLGSTAPDVVGNNANNTGVLHLAGGSFTGTDQGLGLGLGAGPVARLIVTNGTATVALLSLFANVASVELDGGTLAARQVTGLGGAMTFNFNGGLLQARTNAGTFLAGLTRANVRDNGARVNTAGFDVGIPQALHHSNVGGDAATDGGLTKSGLGALTLTGTNTYTGPTAVQAGALFVNGALGAGAVSVGAGAGLGGSGVISGEVTTAGGLLLPGAAPGSVGTLSLAAGLNLSGGDTVRVEVASASSLDRIQVAGLLNPSGVTVIELSGDVASLAPGNYPLLVAGTALLGDDSNFALVAPPSRLATYDLLHDPFSTTQAVYLTVTAGGSPSNLTWKGSAAQWDVIQTTNWLNGVGDDAYYQGDFVTFDATGVAASNVNLTALLTPGSVTVDSSGGGYRFGTTNNARLTGPAALRKLGAGALVVETANDYTGGTAIEAGALILGPGGLPGAGPITNQGELVLNGSDPFTLSNLVSGAGVLVQRSTGRVVLAVSQAYSGGTRIEAGELHIGTGGTAGSAGTGGLTNQGLLVFNRSDALAPPAPLSGTGVVRKLGAQILTLGQQSDFSGPLQISNGAVLVTATGALGTAAAGVTVANNTTLGLSGGLAGLPAEPLQIHGPGALGAGYFFVGSAVQRGALQSVSGSNEWVGPILFDGTGGNTRIGVQDGAVLVLRGSLTESTAGSTIVFRHGNTAGSEIIIAGPGQWTGTTMIFGGGGAVKLGADNVFPTGAVLRVGASGIAGESRFDLNGFDQAVAGLGRASEGPARVLNDGPAPSILTFHVTTDILFFGAIDPGAGGLGVIKRGPASQGFMSNNLYAGSTLIEEGTLELGFGGAISNSAAVAISAGAVLAVTARADRAFTVSAGQTLSGAGTVRGNLLNGQQVEPGLPTGVLTVSGSYTQQTIATLAVQIGGPLPGTEHDVLAVGDQAALDGFLDVAFTGGYTGTPGQVFTVLTASAVSGTFAFTNLPALGVGLAWTVTYAPAAVVLSISGGGPAPTPYELWAEAIPNPALRGDQADADGDGYANLWEYSQGTDPTNGAAGAAISLARTGGVYALKFNRVTSAVDVIYQVEAAGVPTNGAAWAGVASNVFGAGWSGPASVSETNSGAVVQAFAADPDPLATNRALRLRVIRP